MHFENYNVKRVFIFGVEKSENEDFEQLQKEHNEFDDILIGNFIDHFHNLTFKD